MHRRTRPERERLEAELLAPEGSRAAESRGRALPEEPDQYRTAFQRDRDRIIHSKAFRRLKHKTQVFLNPEGDHYVTRLTHTLHVTQVGRAMAAGLGLNEDLTEAICLAHDVGHSPFGHVGEDALGPYAGGEWHHTTQGLRVLTVLEPLNLTWEVLDGVRAHTWRVDPPPGTPEGDLCRFADRVAYLTHDVADAVRAGVLAPGDLPAGPIRRFGASAGEWIGTMIEAVIETSHARGVVSIDEGSLAAMDELRDFLFARVYLHTDLVAEKERAITVIRDLVEHFAAHPEAVPDTYRVDDADDLTRAVDYVSGMTDRFALRTHGGLRT